MAQLLADPSKQEEVIGWSMKSDRKTFGEMYCDFSNTDLRDKIATIKCPSLIIGGDHDILLPKHTMLIADNIPQSYLWILPNSGHSTPIFYKDQFNETVHNFFMQPYRKIEQFGRFE